MTRPNGSPAETLRASQSLNERWFRRPVRSSVRARRSACWKISALRRAIETCAANSWTSSNSCSSKPVASPSRSSVRTPTAPSGPSSGTTIRLPSIAPGGPEVVDPLVGQLVHDQDGLVVLDDPRRDAGLARLPRLQVVVRVHAAGGQRHQQPRGAVHDLDRDVVGLDERPHPVGDLLQHRALVERGQDRLGRAQQLALGRQLALEPVRLLAHQRGGVGVGHRLGRERRVDHQQPQVVLGELAQAELRQHQHAQAHALVDHRRQEHRLVDVGLGARDRDRARVVGRVVDELRDAVLGDPAGHALADLDPQVLDGLVRVHRPVAHHRDRHQVLAVHAVDADVVVVDELPQLGGDGVADLAHLGEARQPRAEALDRLELGRPGGHPAERPGGAHGDGRVAGEGLGAVEVDLAPAVRAVVGEVEHPVDLVPVDERRAQQRVDALLHRGGAERAARAGRVGPDEDHRPARRQLALAEAVDLEGSRGVEEAVGEARAARRRDAALGVVEDHRDPVGAEQDAGVVAEVADDVAHVEPRGEVGGDPAQRLGAAQAGARLLGRVGALDEDPERAGDGPGEPVAVVTAELDRARDDQDAPRVLAARDPHDQLVGAHAEHGGGPVAAGAGVDRLAGLERLREQAAAGRDVAAGGDPRALDVRRARHETARAGAPRSRPAPRRWRRGRGGRPRRAPSPCRWGTRRSRPGPPAGRRRRRSR